MKELPAAIASGNFRLSLEFFLPSRAKKTGSRFRETLKENTILLTGSPISIQTQSTRLI